MSTFSEVFARKENKYRLQAVQYSLLRAAVESHLVPDAFGTSEVRSLYFDTPERSLIERSLDKPLYKEKLRLRVYGAPADEAQVFVEIKKKFKGVVYKRRVSMTLAGARAYLRGRPYEEACARFPLSDSLAAEQSLSDRSRQTAREIDFFRERYGSLEPSMLIVCDRSAHIDPEGSELRVTFDTRLEACRDVRDLALTGRCSPIIRPDEAIMEIKNAGPLPRWLVCALSSCRAYPQSFSKYGTAYMAQRKGVCKSEPWTPADLETAACLIAERPRGRHVRVDERSKTCA